MNSSVNCGKANNSERRQKYVGITQAETATADELAAPLIFAESWVRGSTMNTPRDAHIRQDYSCWKGDTTQAGTAMSNYQGVQAPL